MGAQSPPLSWGMLLLSSGFHPQFEVKPRIDERQNKSALSQILFTTPQKTKGLLVPIDLRYFQIKKVMDSHSKAILHQAQIIDQIKAWYSKGNHLDEYNTFDEVLGALITKRTTNPSFQN